MGRVPIPKPGFLDDCEYLGFIQGERRWRGAKGMLHTWDAPHGEIEALRLRGRHRYVADAITGQPIAASGKGTTNSCLTFAKNRQLSWRFTIRGWSPRHTPTMRWVPGMIQVTTNGALWRNTLV